MQNKKDEITQDTVNNVEQSKAGLWIGYVSTTGVYGDHKGDYYCYILEVFFFNHYNCI
jgi:hypothetical protein